MGLGHRWRFPGERRVSIHRSESATAFRWSSQITRARICGRSCWTIPVFRSQRESVLSIRLQQTVGSHGLLPHILFFPRDRRRLCHCTYSASIARRRTESDNRVNETFPDLKPSSQQFQQNLIGGSPLPAGLHQTAEGPQGFSERKKASRN